MLSINQTKKSQTWLKDLVFFVIVLGGFYAIWIGGHALFTPDEGRYSEVAREMVASGDYVTPRLNGVAFLDKPALYYWLQASAIKFFGLKEAALRFWPALLGVLGCLITYLAGNFLFNRRTGILSALILATCPLYYGAAHYANLDLEVAVLVSNALMLFIMAAHMPLGKIRSATLFGSYFFAGLAFLTKGLIGIVFPAAIIGAWILLLNRWTLLKNIHLMLGLIMFACITIPWYVLVQQANPEFLHFFFVTQQVARFLTKGDYNNKAAFWFYAPIVLAGIFPWTIFVFQSLAYHIKKCWENRQKYATNLFFLLWFLIVFTFFSIPKSKTVGYILPTFPTLALLIGSYLDTQWDNVKAKGIRWGWIAFIMLSAITAVGFFYAPHIARLNIEDDFKPFLLTGGVLFSTAAIVAMFFTKNTSLKKSFIVLLGVACSFLLLMISSTPALNKRSIKPITTELNAIAKPDDEIVTYYKFYYDLPIYTQRRVSIVADWNAPDIAQNDNWVRELWYGMPFQDTKEWLIDKNTFWQRWDSTKRLFVVTDENYYNQLKTETTHLYKIMQYKNVVLLSNQL